MATLEDTGWPRAVMERLDRHGELLIEVKTRLDREIQARLDAIIDRQDKANGRTAKAEADIAKITTWRAQLSPEHVTLMAGQIESSRRISVMEAEEIMRRASAKTSHSWVSEIKWWLLALVSAGTLAAALRGAKIL